VCNKGQYISKYVERLLSYSDFIIFYSFVDSDCATGWIVLKSKFISMFRILRAAGPVRVIHLDLMSRVMLSQGYKWNEWWWLEAAGIAQCVAWPI
jgi:hypothetical protein